MAKLLASWPAGNSTRPLHVADHGLAERLGQLAELDDDRQSLLHMLDALLTRKRLRILAGDAH